MHLKIINRMRVISLLVFSTVYLSLGLISPIFAAKTKSLDLNPAPAQQNGNLDQPFAHSSNSLEDQGFCFDVIAGSKKIGFILETKTYVKSNAHKINKSYTYIKANDKILEEELSTTSDSFLLPLAFHYKQISNSRNLKEVSGKFKKINKNYQADIKVQNLNNKAITKKVTIPKGTVFQSRFIDLIFAQKKIQDIGPKTALSLTAFDEKTGLIQETKTQLDLESDLLKLVHHVNDQTYTTEHLPTGHLVRSLNPKQNITLARCESVSNLLKLAQSQKNFKSLFAKAEKDILNSCCQL